MEAFLLTGLLFGIAAGVAPGPLLTLVVSESLKDGIGAGIKVALAPLLTDVPIVALALFSVAKLCEFDMVLGVISLLGGLFVVYLGVDGIRCKGVALKDESKTSRSLLKGAITNVLSPHPYLFWFSVGAPAVIKANKESLAASIGFLIGFYLLLLGSKIVIAVIAGKSRSFLKGKVYINTMRSLGVLLIGFALFLLRDGLQLLGVIS